MQHWLIILQMKGYPMMMAMVYRSKTDFTPPIQNSVAAHNCWKNLSFGIDKLTSFNGNVHIVLKI